MIGPGNACCLCIGHVGKNVVAGLLQGVAVFFGDPAIPGRSFSEIYFEVPNRLPLHDVECLIDGETEKLGFMHGFRLARIAPVARPVIEHFSDESLYAAIGFGPGAEIESASHCIRIGHPGQFNFAGQ